MLFKFGVYHIKKGRSYTNVYDIGNLAAELAQANNSHSFHLCVIGAAGTQNAYLPFVGNETDKNKKIAALPRMILSISNLSWRQPTKNSGRCSTCVRCVPCCTRKSWDP